LVVVPAEVSVDDEASGFEASVLALVSVFVVPDRPASVPDFFA
jgi:hypothetical protein